MMQFEHNFKVIIDEGEISKRLASFTTQAGFISGEDIKTFRRGIGLKRFLSSFPRNAPAVLNVTWNRDPQDWQVNVVARLSAAGPLLAVDAEYYQAELGALEQALCGKPVDFNDLKRYARAVEMRRVQIGLVIIFFAVLGGTLARMLFENPTAFWMGSAFGASLGIGAARPLARRGIRGPGNQSSMLRTPAVKPDVSFLQLAMRRDIRSWGGWMIVLGIISFVSTGFLDSSWGILLVVVGLGSLVFQTPALYIIYGVTLAWAAVNNALLSSGAWSVFSLVQLVMAVQTFGQFRRYNKAYQAGQRAALEPAPVEETEAVRQDIIAPDPYAPFLPWLSLAMGIFGLFGLLAVLGFSLLQGMFQQIPQISPDALGFASGVAIDFNLLGFSAGLGSLLAHHRFKGASIAGMIAGGLGIVIILGLMIVARVG